VVTPVTSALKVADIVGYLADTGWLPAPGDRPTDGRATLWHHSDDFEVLVPARDGMGDAERRIREILRCLADLEERPMADIASEIAFPQLDRQYFRAFTPEHDPGYISLLSGVQTFNAIRALLDVATRTVAVLESVGQYLARSGTKFEEFFQPDIEAWIRAAYTDLTSRRPGSWVKLSALRPRLSNVPRDVVDAELDRMIEFPEVELKNEFNQSSLDAADREAAVRIGGEARHLLKIEAAA
jgi:hypothetical protein